MQVPRGTTNTIAGSKAAPRRRVRRKSRAKVRAISSAPPASTPFKTPPSVNLRNPYVEQPLPGEPRASRRVREQVCVRDGVILQNPLAGADVPANAGIVQEPKAGRSISQPLKPS